MIKKYIHCTLCLLQRKDGFNFISLFTYEIPTGFRVVHCNQEDIHLKPENWHTWSAFYRHNYVYWAIIF